MKVEDTLLVKELLLCLVLAYEFIFQASDLAKSEKRVFCVFKVPITQF